MHQLTKKDVLINPDAGIAQKLLYDNNLPNAKKGCYLAVLQQ